ncbi:MAG: tRNA (N(6)-L-threonylcarbamoyladenosine(37)-C(2))-methylthiotransferase MtaB [Acidobacteria bacterium]|nr:tRNA (N(6)-L-threonylcarbamoyladenosine(37)-C(2))-methylthiotransferase MtaB [Acidobacteriota bacterium]
MPSYHTHNFGCRANQADGAAIEQDLAARGYVASPDQAKADVVILNSCTVTSAADADLRQSARRIHRDNPQARIVITGCYAQRRPEELAALPGVEWVVGNAHKSEIAGLLDVEEANEAEENALAPVRSSASFFPITQLAATHPDDDTAPLGSIAPAPLARILTSDIRAQRQFTAAPFFGGTVEDRTRPNLKIQDGCNNRCSFCIIPSVRGLSRSLAPAEVVEQVRSLTDAGYREVVISGVNLGQYGRDLTGAGEGTSGRRRTSFVRLLRRVLDETGIEKLRLSSVEPMDFTDTLLDLIASTPRIARHIHAPLQSGSDRILRLMHRKYTAARYRQRILAAYARFPNAAFGADVIVGFPGETDNDFQQTYALIDELPMTYLHVFPYSRRPGTPADQMPDQVPPPVIRERGRLLRDLSARKNQQFRERQVGQILPALTLDKGTSGGAPALSDNYLRIALAPKSEHPAPNTHVRVQIISESLDGLFGDVIS